MDGADTMITLALFIILFSVGILCGHDMGRESMKDSLVETSYIEWEADKDTGDSYLVWSENGEKVFKENNESIDNN